MLITVRVSWLLDHSGGQTEEVWLCLPAAHRLVSVVLSLSVWLEADASRSGSAAEFRPLSFPHLYPPSPRGRHLVLPVSDILTDLVSSLRHIQQFLPC